MIVNESEIQNSGYLDVVKTVEKVTDDKKKQISLVGESLQKK